MLRYAVVPITFCTVLLAGCEIRTKQDAPDAGSGNASGVSISTPEFEGKLKLPGFALGGKNIDLDGMKLYPGSKVTGIDIDADKQDSGQVHIAFSSDAAPAAILDYYRKAASDAGFVLEPPAGSAALSGSKGDKRFALDVKPAASGATGTIALSGS